MSTTASRQLPFTTVESPENESELCRILQQAARDGTPVYPLGGCTGLSQGLPVTTPGIGISLAALQRLVDYPARDMTVTAEAGMLLGDLQAELHAERQWLPVDPPFANQAQLGGLVATNASGPRRFGYGTPREQLIGVRAVDGRGVAFQAGGRVVKNVAGYDFCRLLSGSMGTLAVVTQTTWKLRPLPETKAMMLVTTQDLDELETLLATLNNTDATPTAIELTADARTGSELGIMLEGTDAEVDWQCRVLASELGRPGAVTLHAEQVDQQINRWMTAYEAKDVALHVRVSVPPSVLTSMLESVYDAWPTARVAGHAGNGVLTVTLDEYPESGIAEAITRHLSPTAARHRGHLNVIHNPSGQEMTREVAWGGAAVPWGMMHSVKAQFDPQGILNRNRFFD